LGTVYSIALADYAVSDEGTWPAAWPKELEPLRKQAKTYDGPIDQMRYLIPFTEREEFEAAWPHLLKVKTPGAPIILTRGPRTDFFAIKPAGLLIQTPPEPVGKHPLPRYAAPRAPCPIDAASIRNTL
jgi:hypothetical protein